MDTKIKSRFWRDEQVQDMEPLCKLAVLWLMTAHVEECGYVGCNRRRFEFETGSPWEALGRGCEALGGAVVSTGKGFWLRNYIREQVGVGEALAKNNMAKSICRSLRNVPVEVQRLVLRQYPELKALAKPFVSASCFVKHRRGEERRGEESGEEGVGEGARAGQADDGGSEEGGGGLPADDLELPPGVEFPPGFPSTERQALDWVSGLPPIPEVGPVDPEFVKDIWHSMPGIGFKDGAGRLIEHWGLYVKSRWRKEKGDWLAKRSLSRTGQADAAAKKEKGGAGAMTSWAEPVGWREVWGQHFDFAAPERWDELPEGTQRDVVRWCGERQRVANTQPVP